MWMPKAAYKPPSRPRWPARRGWSARQRGLSAPDSVRKHHADIPTPFPYPERIRQEKTAPDPAARRAAQHDTQTGGTPPQRRNKRRTRKKTRAAASAVGLVALAASGFGFHYGVGKTLDHFNLNSTVQCDGLFDITCHSRKLYGYAQRALQWRSESR